jgi:DNA recombination protein RmuC
MSESMLNLAAVGGLALLLVIAAVAVALLAGVRRLAAAQADAARETRELRTRVEVAVAQGTDLERDVKLELSNARTEQAAGARGARAELAANLGQFGDRLDKLAQSNQERLEAVRVTVEQRLDVLRSENARKLDEMRATVDEKLQTTLEVRLGESFRLVSERLEQVHRGLGEMQNLAAGVGDLKRVLSNVKTRGGWGEVQLGALLAEMLTPQQFAANVETRPGSNKRVEYAIRLPGKNDGDRPCWLPIDCKFPLEDWQRLQDALERADAAAAEDSRKALASFMRDAAKTIRALYVEPPHTTDFAILFVPTESLYAEMMARPGFADSLQREHRVLLTGPMNLAALLNSLQMGFRTLAIEQRSSEVWRVLGAIKAEFGKFGDILAKTQKKLQEASNTIEEARGKSTTIVRRLRDVEALPQDEADRLLGADVSAAPVVPGDVQPLLDGLLPRDSSSGDVK